MHRNEKPTKPADSTRAAFAAMAFVFAVKNFFSRLNQAVSKEVFLNLIIQFRYIKLDWSDWVAAT